MKFTFPEIRNQQSPVVRLLIPESYFNDLGCCTVAEDPVMFNKDDRRLICKDGIFDLYAGKHIHKIQRFIPDKEIGILA